MKPRGRWTVGAKLLGCFGGMLLMSAIQTWSSASSSTHVAERLDRTSGATIDKVVLAGEILQAASEMMAAQRGLILSASQERYDAMNAFKKGFQEAAERVEMDNEAIKSLLTTDQGRRMNQELTEAVRQWRPLFDQLSAECEAHKVTEAAAIADRTVPLQQAIDQVTDEFASLNYESMRKDTQEARDESAHGRAVSIVLLGAALALGGIVQWMVRRINANLRCVATTMVESAVQVAAASNQVAGASQALAHGAAQQAASLEETSASAEEITSIAKKNADLCRQAADLMGETEESVTSGNRSLGEMSASMQHISTTSTGVSRIIKVIDEIAFQTNILALNAAVEAARAGEAGMGFAVVADEVRNLAQRSAQAAKDTAGLIEEALNSSRDGQGKVDHVSVAMQTITQVALSAKTIIDEVSASSQEQTRGIDQIARSVTQMDKVTQQAAASAQQSASAAEQLSAQTEAMRAGAIRLREMVGGSVRRP